jgi:phthalate 4,5-cis-dihydrodiol dehydrogenase
MSASTVLGIVGWGTAGRLMADAVDRSSGVVLGGVADLDARRREEAHAERGCKTFGSLDELLDSRGVDAVYIASPTPHHAAAVRSAATAGAHVIVEKPIAASLEDALDACATAAKHGVALLVGCTHSHDAPIRALRSLIVSGDLGDLLALSSICHTNWRSRPRSAADLDAAAGGGIALRQGSHQLDILRYLAGGLVDTLSGSTFGGDNGTEVGFAATLRMKEGVVATAHYSGAGGFDTRLLNLGIGELGDLPPDVPRAESAHFRLLSTDLGASPLFGFTCATFAGGEAVVTPWGLLLWHDGDVRELRLAPGCLSGWDAVLAELDAAIRGEQPVRTGSWGAATLEACLALHRSGPGGSPVTLLHQVPTAQEVVPTPFAKEIS